jgi:EF-P beta-lysylation protein EpmB
MTIPVSASQASIKTDSWHRSLAGAVRDVETLCTELELPAEVLKPARRAAELFPLLVPRSFLARMERGNPRDPLLLQVLPWGAEFDQVPGYLPDALEEATAHIAPGLLQKYHGRALMIATGACAVHCRYCFRRHYPYGEEPRRLEDWEPAFAAISEDLSLREILLSGGDPLMLTDERLGLLWNRLESIGHLKRIRIHTRLPIVLPDRVTAGLLGLLQSSRLTPIVVVHANHPREVAADCAEALRTLVRSGVAVLNQSVLLKGINDSAEALAELSERLIDLGVMPYYLHQTDRVEGTAHFAVTDATALDLMAELRRRLPGYAVPKLVREIPGELHKTPL